MDNQQAPPSSSSTGRCFGFPCLLQLLALLISAILILIFALKPKKPSFNLHAIQISSVNDSSPIVSLVFRAQNPNKIGIRYSSSELGLVYGSSSNMGLIKIPAFFQPPHSSNVSVPIHVFLKEISIEELITEELNMGGSASSGDFAVRIFGGIQAWGHVLNYRLLKIKVFLDCKITAKLSDIAMSKVFSSSRTHKALLLPNLPDLTHKCSLALCI